MPRLTYFPNGITAVDTEYVRAQMDAAHIVIEQGRAAIVDTGPNSAVPLIRAALEELGIALDAVEYLFLTHVHLDHAGGAGQLMRLLPRATAIAHPRGAPHLVHPKKLIEGTRAVYGDELYSRLYGDIVAIPAERLRVAQEGERFRLVDREFECVHTPGHALHHQAIVDRAAHGIFTGDTFGISYREFDHPVNGAWIMPTTTPTQFDPQQLKDSITRLMQYQPQRLYLTHYSEVRDCERLAADMHAAIDDYARIALEHQGQGPDAVARIGAALREHSHASLRRHGCAPDAARIDAILGKDFELNAAGLVAWLQRRAN